MTLTFNPEIWFKVTENPLPKGKLRVKFKLCWAREKEGVHWTRYLRQTEGRTDWSPQVARRVESLKVRVNSVKKQSNHVVFTVNVDISWHNYEFTKNFQIKCTNISYGFILLSTTLTLQCPSFQCKKVQQEGNLKQLLSYINFPDLQCNSR